MENSLPTSVGLSNDAAVNQIQVTLFMQFLFSTFLKDTVT